MIRVLHLHNLRPEFQTRRTHEALVRLAGAEFDFHSQLLGAGGKYRNLPTAIARLRRETFDIIHCWGIPALTAAAMSGARRIVFSPDRFTSRSSLRWARAIMGYRSVQMICPTATQQRVAVENGIPIERCHLIRPGVEFGRIQRRRDVALREALGFAPDDYVLLAPGESTRSAAHAEGVWACSILHVLDPRYKMLLWGRGRRIGSAAGLGERLRQEQLVKVAEPLLGRTIEFEELLPAADACLVTARGPVATLPIAICMAAALPIVSTVTSTVAELLEDRHTALMVAHPSPRLIAQRILDLREDSSLQWSIADMARTEAYEFFPMSRMLEQYRTVYQKLARGERVELPAQAPGAGMRFHGKSA